MIYMKTFLVKSTEYKDCKDYVYAEIWAAESREQIWNEKHPHTPIGFIPDFEPKRESCPSDKIYNKHYRKYLKEKDKWIDEYLKGIDSELEESYIELIGVSNNETSLKMISRHLIISEVADYG